MTDKLYNNITDLYQKVSNPERVATGLCPWLILMDLFELEDNNKQITLCILMDSSIQFDTMRLEWFIVQIKGSHVRIS